MGSKRKRGPPSSESRTDSKLPPALIAAAAAILVAIIAVVGPYIARRFFEPTPAPSAQLTTAPEHANRDTVSSPQDPALRRLRVTSPQDGAEVGLTAIVRGTTSYSEPHYIVVTPVKTGTPAIQDGPMSNAGGVISGYARFGETGVGLNEDYLVQIRVDGVRTTQSTAPLETSDAITVRRVAPKGNEMTKQRWTWVIFILLVVTVFAGVWLLGATRTSIHITAPATNTKVTERPFVEGRVSKAAAVVAVVLHPMDTTAYWVQPIPSVHADRSWKVQVYIGRPGTIDVGKRFEIRAFANPKKPLKEGEVLDAWPIAAGTSDVVEVQRQ